MERLDEIIRGATEEISEEYFLLPIHGAPAQRRERVYCYELYHQMRSLWPDDGPWFLNGEVDKGGHPLFAGAGAPKPDFLVHVPGQNRNYAALEVKPVSFVNSGIRKDLETLQMFRERGYERAILLVYGAEPDEAVRRLRKCRVTPEKYVGIELWVHPHAHRPADRFEV